MSFDNLSANEGSSTWNFDGGDYIYHYAVKGLPPNDNATLVNYGNLRYPRWVFIANVNGRYTGRVGSYHDAETALAALKSYLAMKL